MEHKVPKHFIDFLISRGRSPEQIRRTSSEMSRKGIVNWQDFVWSLLQEVILECALNATSEEQLFQDQHKIYSEMSNLNGFLQLNYGNIDGSRTLMELVEHKAAVQ